MTNSEIIEQIELENDFLIDKLHDNLSQFSGRLLTKTELIKRINKTSKRLIEISEEIELFQENF